MAQELTPAVTGNLRVHAETPPRFLPWQPSRQIVWDATSLRTFQECARKYWYKHIQGWAAPGDSIDLLFGSALGAGLETYHKELHDGTDPHEALRRAIRCALAATWDDLAGAPRMGSFHSAWRCTGTKPYKNAKGNAAKCPHSHKGKWFPAPAPTPCICGSPTTTSIRWVPERPAKDRVQLIRALVWYAEEQKERAFSPISVSGQAAVELPFLVPFTNLAGVPYYLCGWWDAIKQLGGEGGPCYVTDYKTTGNTIGGQYWAGWQPNIQVDLYDLVASRFAPVPVDGVGIEGIQVGCDRTGEGWVRFGYRTYTRSAEQREELVQELNVWLAMAASFAQNDYWPMNRSSCKLCEFKGVCNMAPAQRDNYLREHFVRERWNPLTRTVEILDEPHTTIREQPDRSNDGLGRGSALQAGRLPLRDDGQGGGQQEADERGAIAGRRGQSGVPGTGAVSGDWQRTGHAGHTARLTLVPRDSVSHRQPSPGVLQPGPQLDGSPA